MPSISCRFKAHLPPESSFPQVFNSNSESPGWPEQMKTTLEDFPPPSSSLLDCDPIEFSETLPLPQQKLKNTSIVNIEKNLTVSVWTWVHKTSFNNLWVWLWSFQPSYIPPYIHNCRFIRTIPGVWILSFLCIFSNLQKPSWHYPPPGSGIISEDGRRWKNNRSY